MTFDEAMNIAKRTPGQGVRDDATMTPKWKVVWIAIPRLKGGGAYFCINPITNGSYEFVAVEANIKSTKWSLI